MSNEKNQNEELLTTQEASENTEEKKADISDEEVSTPSIFDKPDHDYKKVKKHIPMWLKAALAVVICAAIVVSAVYIPKILQEDPSATESTESQAEVTITLCDYSQYNATMDEVEQYGKGGIKNITYSVGGFDFELIQGKYEETTTDSEGNQTTTEKVGWTIGNYEGIRWSDTNVSGLVQNALQVTAITKLEESAEDMSVYGLNEDGVFSTLSVNFKDGTGYTVLVGNYSGDSTGRYIRFSDSKTVYLSSYSFATYTSLSAKELPTLYTVGAYESVGNDSEYYSDGTLTFFDGIFLFGEKVPETIAFTPADTLDTYTYYKLVAPVEMAADDTAVQEVFSLLTAGITATEVLEFMPSKETTASYGLYPEGDNNYLKVMYVVAGVTYQFAIGDVLEDGYYPVMVNSANVIYKVSPDIFTFMDYKYTDYMRKTLFLAGIVDMDSFSVKGEGIDETFIITNTLEDEENQAYTQTVKLKNGKSIDDAAFKNALATFQRLQATDYDDENYGETSKKPVLTITVSYIDKERKDSVITFYEYSSRRYLYKIDGEGNALISIGDYEGVVEAAKTAQNSLI